MFKTFQLNRLSKGHWEFLAYYDYKIQPVCDGVIIKFAKTVAISLKFNLSVLGQRLLPSHPNLTSLGSRPGHVSQSPLQPTWPHD